MTNTTLKLYEYLSLDNEINGLINQQNGEKIISGLLNEKLNLVTKYWLTDLSKKVIEEKTNIENLRTDLIKQLGTEDEKGNISIPYFINEEKDKDGKIISAEPHPTYLEFQKELNTLLEEEKKLEHYEFTLEEFKNIETTENYDVFYKLIKV